MSKEENKSAFDTVVDFFSKKGTKVSIVEVKEIPLIAFANDKENHKLEKFEELNLIDGETVVMIEPEVAVDAAIAIFDTASESWIPAPPSDYELEDGRIVTVEVDGLIAMVQEVAADGEEVVEPIVEEDLSKEAKDPKRIIESTVKESVFTREEFDALLDNVTKQAKEIEFLLESLETKTKEETELKDEFAKVCDFVEDKFKVLFAEPAAEPVVKRKTPLKKEEKPNVFFNRTKEK